MNVGGQSVQFHLSPEGRKALRGLIPETGSFQAFVLGQEDIGLLIWRPLKRSKQVPERIPVMLLRWDYIATMSFDYQAPPAGGPSRPKIGFHET